VALEDRVIVDDRLERVLLTATQREPGLWVADDDGSKISYPESGHRNLVSIEDESYWFRHRASALLGLMAHFPPPGSLFDVGGGNGYMVRALRDSGHEAILLEPGAEGCAAALRRGLAPVVQGTTKTAGVRLGSIPAVGLFDVVEHIDDDADFLHHIYDLLSPGGRLYLTVPAHQALWSHNDVSAGHFRRYSKKEIERLVAEAGFGVLSSTYLFRSLVLPVFIFRSVPFRLEMRESNANTTEAHRLPGGAVGRMVSRSLARELRTIERGSSVKRGSSVMLVGDKPG
jgi:SAM-dependent methyltransferase